MATKNKAEAEAIILKLLNIRIGLPEYAMMGEKNWARIDMQVQVLRNNYTQEQIDQICKKETEAFKISVNEARMWLDGTITDFDLLGGNV